jgi:ParB-like chromosome segregation protein Spo0J
LPEELTTKEQREHLLQAERKARKAVERKAAQLETLEIVYVPIDSIKPNPWNPNRQSDHDFELLLRSMEEDGFTQPVVTCKITAEDMEVPRIKDAGYLEVGDTMIVDGEHRWRARRKLGWDDIAITIAPMAASQAMIATLRHNRARGSEDFDLAAEVLQDLQALGSIAWAQDALMLDDTELERILANVNAPEALAGDGYGEAWIPDRGKGGDGEDLTLEAKDVTGRQGDEWRNAGTAQAIELQREREEKLREAKTEEQREMIRRDSAKDFFRLSLIFSGEEGRIVREALGKATAEKLVDLCRSEVGELERSLGEGWVTVDSIIGGRTIPGHAAQILKDALDTMEMSGDLGEKNRWQGLEYMAAEYLAGAIASASDKGVSDGSADSES